MPTYDRMTKFFNHRLFKQWLAEDERLAEMEARTLITLDIDNIATESELEEYSDEEFHDCE